MDFRKNRRAHGPVTTNSSPVVIKIPGRSAVRLPIWALNISSILKKDTTASVLAKETCTANLVSFYQSTVECPDWVHYSLTARDQKLHRTVRTASKNIGTDLPPLQQIYSKHWHSIISPTWQLKDCLLSQAVRILKINRLLTLAFPFLPLLTEPLV